jgi:hypothetical protein
MGEVVLNGGGKFSLINSKKKSRRNSYSSFLNATCLGYPNMNPTPPGVKTRLGYPNMNPTPPGVKTRLGYPNMNPTPPGVKTRLGYPSDPRPATAGA